MTPYFDREFRLSSDWMYRVEQQTVEYETERRARHERFNERLGIPPYPQPMTHERALDVLSLPLSHTKAQLALALLRYLHTDWPGLPERAKRERWAQARAAWRALNG